jgi:hypothetical protein
VDTYRTNSNNSAAATATAPTSTSYDTPGAAAVLGISPGTLRNMRSQAKGPAYYRVGKRIVYRRADLNAFLSSCRVEPTG